MIKITIVEGKQEHAESACNVVRASITGLCQLDHNNDPVQIAEWLANKTKKNFETWIRQNTTFCAFDHNGVLTGVAMLSPDQEVLLNYVMPEIARAGIGTGLLHAMESRCPVNTSITARSTVSALGFYQRRGFTPSSENPDLLEKIILAVKT